jgi:MFS family permease
MNPWRGIGRLPKELWVLYGTTLINRMGTMGLPFLIVYLTQGMGYSAAQAGFVMTVYGASSLLASPFSGRLSDIIGPLRIMKMSLWFTGVALILFPFAHSYWLIIVATMCWSVVSEAFRPASLSIISDLVHPEQRKLAFSVNRLAVNVGMGIGPAVGGFLILYSFPLIFWVDGIASLIAASILTFVVIQQPRHQSEPETQREVWSVILRDKRLLIFVGCLFPVFVTFFQYFSTFPYVCIHELSLAPSDYGLFFTVNTTLIILIEVPLNVAMSRWSHRHSMVLGALLVGLGFGGMLFTSGFLSVALTVVIWTFGEMIFLPSASAYVADIAAPERRGAYMGVYQMVGNASFAVSGWFGMKFLESFGSSILWGTVFLVCIVSAISFLRFREPKKE